jgi:type IX secretion system PorP/SprF family membrane protein
MRKILTLITSILLADAAIAQQDPQFSMGIQNRMAINPGYAGSSGFLCGNLLARQQWFGVNGAPKSIAFSGDMPLMKETNHPIGVGLTVMADKAGLLKSTYAKAAAAYRLLLSGGSSLGIGVEAGVMNVGYESGGFIPETQADSRIPFNGVSRTGLDIGFGLHYSIPNQFHIGISVGHLNAGKFKYKGDTAFFSSARHIYVTAGYDYTLPNNPEIILKPSILLKNSLGSSLQLDVNIIALYNNSVWGGLSYRVISSDAVVPMVGYQKMMMDGKGTLKLGYSYDLTLSKLRTNSSGSHEILLGFCYDITPPVKVTKYRNPRFL